MTRWQRMDLLARHYMEMTERAQRIRGTGWKGLVQAVVSKVLGFG